MDDSRAGNNLDLPEIDLRRMGGQVVIITGTSGSGKTAIVKDLCARGPKYEHIRAVTTRARRTGDAGEYDYINRAEFDYLVANSKLLVQAEYRGEKYGIKFDEVERTERSGKIGLLTLTSQSAGELIKNSAVGTYVSFFVDAPNDELDRRLSLRPSQDVSTARQRDNDRLSSHFCLVTLINRDLADTVALIECFIGLDRRSGVLTKRVITTGIKCGVYLERAVPDNVSGASYDLTLGDEYFYAGRIQRLDDSNPILLIEPYDYAIVTSSETANLPLNACGRFDLSVSLFSQGIILSNGPQVDPGFRGPLFCLLFNTSSSPVLLKRRKHYATLELHQLIEPTNAYRGQYQAKTLLDYLPSNAARGAINDLKREVEGLKAESRNLQAMTLAMISLVLAVVAIWVSLK